jgi:hypothetical protein
MITAEDRARAAMRAIASTVDAAPPLRLAPAPEAPARRVPWRPRRARGWRAWITPVMAAVTVLAVGLSLAIVRGAPASKPHPGRVPYLQDGVPAYYMALGAPVDESSDASATVVVGETTSGKRLFTVGPFAGGNAIMVTAAADDRTFLVATQQNTSFSFYSPGSQSLYLIHITPGTRPGYTERELPIQLPVGHFSLTAMALSPDGTRLALAGPVNNSNPTKQAVRIYSVTTGKVLDTWTQTGTGFALAISSLWWTDDARQLAFSYQAEQNAALQLRLLPVTLPGHDLLADSRTVWSANEPAQGSTSYPKSALSCAYFPIDVGLAVTADGTTMVCAASGVFRDPGNLPNDACPAVPPWNDEAMLEYSTTTGKLTRTLYSFDTNCVPAIGGVAGTGVLWTSANGDTVIGSFAFSSTARTIVRFGIYSEHTFRPLPLPPATEKGAAAW